MAQFLYESTPAFRAEKKLSKGTMAAMHYHNAYEIYYLLNGERDYLIGDRFYKVKAGDLVLIPPSVLHRTAGRTGSRILFYFTDDFLARFFTQSTRDALALGEPLVYRPTDDSGESLAPLFEASYAAFSDRQANENNDPLLAGYLFRILFSVTHGRNGYEQGEYSDGRIVEIVRYVNEHYGSIESIRQLADRFFLSEYYFCRLFRKHLGVSATAYLNTIKIRAACNMLKTESRSLTEIATHCGFNSSSYFCRVFRNEMGTSPSAYRKQNGR